MGVTDLAALNAWLSAPEDEHLEFKEAKNRFDFEELVKYCAALANEGGGRMILGVADARPRRVVGCHAFPDLERTKAALVERLVDSRRAEGCQLAELHQVLPQLSRRQVQGLLRELKTEGRAHHEGRTSTARWHPGPER